MSNNHRGFTLIELMVVMSIISTLSSVVLSSVSYSRMKARDARRVQDFHAIELALTMFYDQKGRFPKMYLTYAPTTGLVSYNNPSVPGANTGGCDAIVPNVPGADPNNPPNDARNVSVQAWDASMQELVDAGFLGAIPHSPGGPGYCYTTYPNDPTESAAYVIPLSKRGGVLMTSFETGTTTTTGIPPSCRYTKNNGSNWCNQQQTRQYCLCIPY